MKINPDKHTKSVSLTLALQRYESSPKYNKDFQRQQQIITEQIKIPALLRFQDRQQSNKPNNTINRQISKSRQKFLQKQRQKANKARKDVDSEDEDSLFEQCNSLTSKIQTLKIEKYENAVQQFQQQERKRMEYVLNLEENKIRSKYSEIKKDLQNSFDQQKLKVLRHLDEVNKFKSAYQAMSEQLSDKKSKIQNEYRESIIKIKESKEKLISQWKRNSNEQIMKLGIKNI